MHLQEKQVWDFMNNAPRQLGVFRFFKEKVEAPDRGVEGPGNDRTCHTNFYYSRLMPAVHAQLVPGFFRSGLSGLHCGAPPRAYGHQPGSKPGSRREATTKCPGSRSLPPTRRAGEDIRGGRLPPASWRSPAETPRARPSSPECLKKDAHGRLFWGAGRGPEGEGGEGGCASVPGAAGGERPDPGLPQDGGRHAAALARRGTLWPARPPAQRAEAKRRGHPTILAR